MSRAGPRAAPSVDVHADQPCYVLGDMVYDGHDLYVLACPQDLQLLGPRKYPHGHIGARARDPRGVACYPGRQVTLRALGSGAFGVDRHASAVLVKEEADVLGAEFVELIQ